MKEKNSNLENKWWQPNQTEYIMLSLTVVTVIVSIVSQASHLVSSFLQFDKIYKQLYPLLNAFHIFVIGYIMYQLQNVKQLMPETDTKNEDEKHKKRAKNFKEELTKWIKNYIGEHYYKEEKDFDDFVKKQIKTANKNTNKLYVYWYKVFAWFIVLYMVEFLNSFTPYTNEPVLQTLVIIANNVATLYWFFIYLKLNCYEDKITLTQKKDDREILEISKITVKRENKNTTNYFNEIFFEERLKNITIETKNITIAYYFNKILYSIEQWFNLSSSFGKNNKYKEYEDGEKDKIEMPKFLFTLSKKYFNWKTPARLLLFFSIGCCVGFLYYFLANNTVGIEYLSNELQIGYKTLMYISVLFCACAMLAAFSRLGSGFLNVPLSALLVMLFYAAVQPLFFAESEFDNQDLKMGQLMFIINMIFLIGKFGLLYIIKWIFTDYRISYHFINEQILKNNPVDDKEDIEKVFPKKFLISEKN